MDEDVGIQGELFDPTLYEIETDEPTEEQMLEAGLVPVAVTGYAVVLGTDGVWRASSNLEWLAYVSISREADTADFIRGGASTSVDAQHRQVVYDVTNNVVNNIARTLPNLTADQIANRARAVQEQMANHAVMSQMAEGQRLIRPR